MLRVARIAHLSFKMKVNQEKLIKKLKELDVVVKEPVKLRGGEKSDFYVDIKKAYGDPVAFSLISNAMADLLDDKATCIAASGYGGLPLATVIALKNNLKLVLVRDSVKDHGTRSLIDGYVPTEKDKVVIIDDVLTTGSSIAETIGVLKETNVELLAAYVVVKRGNAQLEIPIKHLLTVEELKD